MTQTQETQIIDIEDGDPEIIKIKRQLIEKIKNSLLTFKNDYLALGAMIDKWNARLPFGYIPPQKNKKNVDFIKVNLPAKTPLKKVGRPLFRLGVKRYKRIKAKLTKRYHLQIPAFPRKTHKNLQTFQKITRYRLI